MAKPQFGTTATQRGLADGEAMQRQERARCWKRSKGPGGDFWYLAFSPDGKQLVARSEERVIMLWDVVTSRARIYPAKGR